MLRDFAAIREAARARGPKRVAVAGVGDAELEESLREAARLGLAQGVPAPSAEAAAALVRAGDCQILMKGTVDTGSFMRAVLDKGAGLRGPSTAPGALSERSESKGSGLMSHICAIASRRLGRVLLVTDGGINIAPSLEEKAQIIRNALPLAAALGIDRPRVAVLAATEKPNPRMPETLDAVELARMSRDGRLSGCAVGGPLALDGCVSAEAAARKGIQDPVAGAADIILVPSAVAGNAMCKAIMYFAGDEAGGFVAGAAAPVVFLSRADDARDRLNSIALGVLMSGGGP